MRHKLLIICILAIIISNMLGITQIINNRIYDYFIIFNQKQTNNTNVIIIGIDNKSIKRIGYWPWERRVYANVLDKVIKASPAVIGINLYFANTDGTSEDDQILIKTLKEFENIIISTKYEPKENEEIHSEILSGHIFPSIKRGHVLLENNEIIRHFSPYLIFPAFSIEILRLYYDQKPVLKSKLPEGLKDLLYQKEKFMDKSTSNILIDYHRKPTRFKTYSFTDVLYDKVPLKVFKDKIVLLGVSDQELSNLFATPLSLQKDRRYSVSIEMQAQIIDSLMDYRGLTELSTILVNIVSFLIAGLFFFFSRKKNIVYQGLYFIISMALILGIDFVLFKYFALWAPPGILLLLIFLIFSIFIYLTIDKVDNKIIDAIQELKKEEEFALPEIPEEINNKLALLENLTRVIRKDRLRIKSIINNIYSGIMLLNIEGKILWINKASLDMFNMTITTNNKIQDLLPDIYFDDVIKEISKNNIYKQELKINFSEYLLCITPSLDNFDELVAILYDITELKEIDRLKTNMMRMVSHEIKTPLMNIVLASETINFQPDNENFLPSNSIIQKSADQILSTIDNYLNINKLESNMMKLNLKETNLVCLIEKCIDIQSLHAAKNNIKLVPEYNNIADVICDETLIEIVINNLLSNSIKYSANNSTVRIKLELENQYVNISVIDTGIGIAEDEQDRIFDKFYRAKNNDDLQVLGTGLGLAIVQGILHLHNTAITLNSSHGKGSVFSFKLSCAEI